MGTLFTVLSVPQVADRSLRDVGLHARHCSIPSHQAKLAPSVVGGQRETFLLLLNPLCDVIGFLSDVIGRKDEDGCLLFDHQSQKELLIMTS